VKKSWDSLNLVLVLFAIACAFLNRNHNIKDQSVPNASQEADPEREEAGRRRNRLTQKEKRVSIFKNPSTVLIFKNPPIFASMGSIHGSFTKEKGRRAAWV
jgi:hypothetical protein